MRLLDSCQTWISVLMIIDTLQPIQYDACLASWFFNTQYNEKDSLKWRNEVFESASLKK